LVGVILDMNSAEIRVSEKAGNVKSMKGTKDVKKGNC
jgi:hypothetical protein